MKNSNALATNNQLPDKITLIIYQAQSTQQAVIITIWGERGNYNIQKMIEFPMLKQLNLQININLK